MSHPHTFLIYAIYVNENGQTLAHFLCIFSCNLDFNFIMNALITDDP